MKPEHRPYTAFQAAGQLYQMTVLPMGHVNSSAWFTELMNIVLQGMRSDEVLAYLDDIVLMGQTEEEHIETFMELIKRFKRAGLKLKPKKCHLFKSKVRFLGVTYDAEGRHCDSDKVEGNPDHRPTYKCQWSETPGILLEKSLKIWLDKNCQKILF